jgi:hypothetical protein
VAVVEAGTGTGKSLAYLLPAALWALRNGERTVVSTNTINLQEQLVGKDLPLVEGLLGEDLHWALVKGRGNYVSIRRLLLAAESAPTLFEDDRSAELDGLRAWVSATEDGSLSDLSAPPSDEVWEEVRSDGDICLKARCPHFQQCFYQRARRKAAAADLLVVNHALLFSDLSLRRAADNWAMTAVLPPYRHVILDEAHNVEDAATSHLGAEATRLGLFRLLSRLDRNGKGVLAAVEERLKGEAAGTRRSASRIRRPPPPRGPPGAGGPGPLLRRAGAPGSRRGGGAAPPRPGRSPGSHRRRGHPRGLRRPRGRLRAPPPRGGGAPGAPRGGPGPGGADGGPPPGPAGGGAPPRVRGGALATVLAPGDGATASCAGSRGGGGAGSPFRNVRLAAAPVEPGELLREALFDQVDTRGPHLGHPHHGASGFRFIRERLGLLSG